MTRRGAELAFSQCGARERREHHGQLHHPTEPTWHATEERRNERRCGPYYPALGRSRCLVEIPVTHLCAASGQHHTRPLAHAGGSDFCLSFGTIRAEKTHATPRFC